MARQMEESAAPSTSKITAQNLVQVSVINGEAFVWSAASIALLRRQHGIVGLLTGSLPLIPQQNAFLGVPLQLFEEEVVYLLRRKAVILLDDTKAHDIESFEPQALESWHESRTEKILETRLAAADEAKQMKSRLLEKHAVSEAARIKKQQREERRQKETANVDESDLHQQPSAPATSSEDVSTSAHTVYIPSTSKHLGWHNIVLGENAFDTLSSAARSGLWRYPENADQRAKCAAFEALRAKQYFLGKGIRFGGDFVVYPGDPLRYHSHFTATIQTTPQTQISAHELIAAGRLGTAVKKSHLLCSVKEAPARAEDAWQYRVDGYDDSLEHTWGHVDFISLTWAGFGV